MELLCILQSNNRRLFFSFKIHQLHRSKWNIRSVFLRISHPIYIQFRTSRIHQINFKANIIFSFHTQFILCVIQQTEIIRSKYNTCSVGSRCKTKLTLQNKYPSVLSTHRIMRCTDPLCPIPGIQRLIHQTCLKPGSFLSTVSMIIPDRNLHLITGTGQKIFSSPGDTS